MPAPIDAMTARLLRSAILKESTMVEEDSSILNLAVQIACAHVSNNGVALDELPKLLAQSTAHWFM
jgi:predicted transcriptional regulator